MFKKIKSIFALDFNFNDFISIENKKILNILDILNEDKIREYFNSDVNIDYLGQMKYNIQKIQKKYIDNLLTYIIYGQISNYNENDKITVLKIYINNNGVYILKKEACAYLQKEIDSKGKYLKCNLLTNDIIKKITINKSNNNTACTKSFKYN